MMELMQRDSTDKRLDDLTAKVEQRFAEVDHRFDQVDQRFAQVDQRLDRIESDLRTLGSDMKAGFELVNERFEAMHRLLLQFCGLMMAALIGLIATQV
jgi:tetrahydromethanopterin S-methyltransferase subunit G